MKDTKSMGYIIGQALGVILLACLAACLGGSAIALTLKFLLWIF
jgi:hypothetical protein